MSRAYGKEIQSNNKCNFDVRRRLLVKLAELTNLEIEQR